MTNTDIMEFLEMPEELRKKFKKQIGYSRTLEGFVLCTSANRAEDRETIRNLLEVHDDELEALRTAGKTRLAATPPRVVHGKLDGFFETGTEGVIWMVYEDGKTGYDGLVEIEDFDRLVVYRSDGMVKHDVVVTLDWEIGYQPYPLNPQHGQQAALGMWVHGIQKGFQPDDWAKLFFKLKDGSNPEAPYRATLTKLPPTYE